MASKIYLDTNILLDLLSYERVNSLETKELLFKYSNEKNKFVINDLSFDNPMFEVYYLKEDDLKEIYNYMNKNKRADFEDLQQYISAKKSDCSMIITNDRHFPKIDIPLIRTNPKLNNYSPGSVIKFNRSK